MARFDPSGPGLKIGVDEFDLIADQLLELFLNRGFYGVGKGGVPPSLISIAKFWHGALRSASAQCCWRRLRVLSA